MNLNDDKAARTELTRALATGHPETIAKAAMGNVWPLYSAHFELLTDAIEQLPASVLGRYPVLRVLHRMTPVLARTSRPFKPLIYPEDARAMSADELDLLTLAQMIAFRLSGDVAGASIYARRLTDRIEQIRVDSRDRTDGPLWFYHLQIGSTHLAAGDSAQALLQLATARQLGRICAQPDAERFALSRIALAHAVRGSLEEASSALTEISTHPAPTSAHVASTRATERTAAALVAVERMSDETDALLAELEPYDSVELTWPFALLARVRAFLAWRRPDDALEALRLADDAHPAQHASAAVDIIAAGSIEAYLAIGDDGAARRIAESHAHPGIRTRLAAARLALCEGRLDVATDILQSLSGDHSHGPGMRAEHFLLSTWMQMARTGEIERQTAMQVARLAATGGIRRLLTTLPRQLIDLVRRELVARPAAEFELATTGLRFTDRHPRPVLTSGELRVLRALPTHRTTAEIAATFHVSPNTIKSQLKSLYRKLGCSTRDEAIAQAARFHFPMSPADVSSLVR